MQHPDSFTRQSKSALIHFSKGKTGQFKKSFYFIFFFLCGRNADSCKVKVTGKSENLDDGERH